jgi:hypothetical protein
VSQKNPQIRHSQASPRSEESVFGWISIEEGFHAQNARDGEEILAGLGMTA